MIPFLLFFLTIFLKLTLSLPAQDLFRAQEHSRTLRNCPYSQAALPTLESRDAGTD